MRQKKDSVFLQCSTDFQEVEKGLWTFKAVHSIIIRFRRLRKGFKFSSLSLGHF